MHAETFAGIIFQQRNTFERFAFGLFQDFALFAGHGPGNLVRTLPGNIGCPPNNPTPLRARGIFPISKGCFCRLNGSLRVGGCGCRKFGQYVIEISGVDIPHQSLRLGVDPLTVYI